MLVFVKELLVVVNQSLYCASLVPQIIKNFYVKSGKSLSDLFLLAMVNSFVCFSLYFFCLAMPLGYKISALLQLVATVILIVQRFMYHAHGSCAPLALIYGVNVILVAIAVLCAWWNPALIGNLAGWAAVALIVVCRIPQIIKIQREKAVGHFSILMVYLTIAAALMEIVLTLVYRFPVQTLCSSSWALFTAVLFLVQFKVYGTREIK